jgi:hypothetical protein
MLPPQRPTVACAGCVAEARSNNEHIARSLDGLPSLVPLSPFATDIFPKLQADISERVGLLRFAKLAPAFSNRARPESRRFASRLGHGPLALLASYPPTSVRLGELRDKSMSTTTQSSASRSIVCSPYPHPVSSLLYALPLLVVFAISRFKQYGERLRRRVLIC